MYQLTNPSLGPEKSTIIKRLSDNAYIPMDEANTDYQAYLAWVAEGNEPTPAEEA